LKKKCHECVRLQVRVKKAYNKILKKKEENEDNFEKKVECVNRFQMLVGKVVWQKDIDNQNFPTMSSKKSVVCLVSHKNAFCDEFFGVKNIVNELQLKLIGILFN